MAQPTISPPGPGPLHLTVTIHRPEAGNYDHWALHLQPPPTPAPAPTSSSSTTTTSTRRTTSPTMTRTYEITNESPHFIKSTHSAPPDKSTLKETVFIARVNSRDVPIVEAVVENARVDNETTHWNCQDYVLEIIEGLEGECVIGFDDDDEEEEGEEGEGHEEGGEGGWVS